MQDASLSYSDLSLPDIAGLPAADTLVLTVNNRLSRRLTLELAGLLRQERQVSELPRILPLSAWLAESANELAFEADDDVPAYRLDSFATQLVWTEAIRAEEAERVLLDASQAARLSMDADLLMDEWELQVPSGADTDEYRGFAKWRVRYRQTLAGIDAEDANQGYARVLRALEDGRLATPRQLVLAGFTDISPRFQRLLRAFEAQGTDVAQWRDAQRVETTARRFEAADQGAEWRAAAAWAASQLKAHPTGRYAIVSPQLEAESPFARRVLSQALAGRDGAPALAFNVAVGRPLDEWPMARAALAWLRALAECAPGKGCGVDVLGAALLAGHCASDVRDRARLAAIDARWRRQARLHVSPQDLRKLLADIPALAQAWNQAMEIWTQGGRQATCDVWMLRMKAALMALGFPGEAALDSVGYQVMGALGDALGSFSALAPAAGRLGGVAAVNLLESVARSSSFQPQRDPLARLDVLGLLEAEGGYWDGVWMLGLTDDVLPASPKPNPLLPLAVLRQARAPRATPEREREWAEGMYAALCRCAPEIIVSHSHMDGERELRPSPLIAATALTDWTPAQPESQASLSQESLDDTRGPPLAAGNRGGGGLDVLDTQARNPLWAFVRHRLGGRELAPYADAATVNVRGQFLHKALELVWGMMPDQETLHELLATGRLGALLEQAVAQAADEELKEYAPALRELECQRAHAVLASWLDMEAQRLPFAVAQVEKNHQWQRGALTLKLRLDRIDSLADGRSVIVDYKTGVAAAKPEPDWSRSRPVNVQLPFYASVLADAAGGEAAGLVLAQIHARQVAAQGLADEDLGMPGVTLASESKYFDGLSWPEIRQRWRVAIEALADEYVAGYAANVAYRRDDLKYCDALPFLRLHLDDEDA
ncbi:PD-(D/E)XK nuclease family protein [Achromobacter deleyi]|uniref:PD-(D/E)XK nuclease family protein n=1 Tax=Achromobacter deleyi TaxID=1353891 RepID=UPI001492F732|nr:PD-(D/E)XK nuclease family protein [Achromobacter deleyi]QVQ26756.1 PD-(D/E)XK nuclease family protein [Achromobacter deleyi]UIP22332.1 PD-(D/E)XK nuclease family protein [Achromobacter deleyi]